MKNRKKTALLIVLIILLLLLGIKSCSFKRQDLKITNDISTVNLIDPNMVKLKELVEEDELCDDEWAKKFIDVGKTIVEDSNFNYLKKYYENDEISENFIKKYKKMGELSIKFGNLFLDKQYKEASEYLKKIKEKFLEIGDYSNEPIY